ncbi:MAG: hypothetical protein GY808_12455, partial [Gammaproteobacteria bacterium]|nr:hypothetical protein [Gammaproteobacteria bacterium]
VNQSYGGIDYAFSHWNDGIKNPYRELELENDGNYTAVYTGHLYSTSTTATATGGSRKVWSNGNWDPSDPWGDPVGYRVIYEDNGDIYYTEYRYMYDPNFGTAFWWTDEQLISDGSGNSKYPCLEVHFGAFDYNVHIVWQKYNSATQNYEIKHTVNYSGGSHGYWETPNAPYIGVSTSSEARPVVGGFGWPEYALVWNSGNGIKYWSSEMYMEEPVIISQNSSLCKNPAISTGGRPYFHRHVAIAWEKDGDIFYKDFLELDDPVTAPIEDITGSYSWLSNCQKPSIASHHYSETMLTWEGKSSTYAEKILGKNTEAIPPPASMRYNPIFARKKVISASKSKSKSESESESEWGTLKEIMYSTYSQITPSVGSIGYRDFSVIWKVKTQNKIAKLDYIDGEGWNLDSEIEIFTSTGSSNPSISTASWA